MNLSEPSEVVCPTLDGPVLTVLAGTRRSLAAREVARLVRRGSWEGVRKVLIRLAGQGIVSVQEAGNATLYSLNRRHVAAPAVEVLVGLRDEVVRRLSEAFASWSIPAVHASVFGSAARGDGDVASDVDLFVVRPRSVPQDEPLWREQLDELAADVLDWTGNHAGISEVGEGELNRVRKTAAARQIRRDGVTLAGKSLEKVLGGGAP